MHAQTGEDGPELLKAHVAVPSQEDMEQLITKRKKDALMSRYCSTALQQGEDEAKAMLNVRR